MSQPWKTEQWFTSLLNWEAEVRRGLHFPEKVRIHDVTLREGGQQAGVILRREEKVTIARKLAEAGVHRIEAGMPAVSADDEAAIKDIVAEELGPEIFSFARCIPQDVKLAKECGVFGIVTEIPSSDHIIRTAYGRDRDWAIKASIETTLAAKDAGLYTVFFTIDSTRSEPSRLLDLIDQVATEGHMDAMCIADSFGGCTPQAISMFVKCYKKRFQQPLEIHCHEDFGLGVANTIAALAAGAEVAQVTVAGTGERAGNVPLEDTVMALKALYGVDTGVKTEKLYELSKMVQQICGIVVPMNRPIVGDWLYNIESGIIGMFHRRCKDVEPLEYIPFAPSMASRPGVEVALGKGSGLANIEKHLEKRGRTATPEQANELMKRVKTRSVEKKGLLSDSEFDRFLAEVIG